MSLHLNKVLRTFSFSFSLLSIIMFNLPRVLFVHLFSFLMPDDKKIRLPYFCFYPFPLSFLPISPTSPFESHPLPPFSFAQPGHALQVASSLATYTYLHAKISLVSHPFTQSLQPGDIGGLCNHCRSDVSDLKWPCSFTPSLKRFSIFGSKEKQHNERSDSRRIFIREPYSKTDYVPQNQDMDDAACYS